MEEALEGLAYMHGQGVVHGSIDPTSIWICEGCAVLTDFMLSSIFSLDDSFQGKGSINFDWLRYRAPEGSTYQWSRDGASEAGDIYGWAMTAFYIIEGCEFDSFTHSSVEFNVNAYPCLPATPFHSIADGYNAHNAAQQGVRPQFSRDREFPDLWKLLQSCWAQDPQQRPSAVQALSTLTSTRALSHPASAPSDAAVAHE